jgi:hypothetical protein
MVAYSCLVGVPRMLTMARALAEEMAEGEEVEAKEMAVVVPGVGRMGEMGGRDSSVPMR